MRQCVVSNGTVVAQTKKLTRSGLGALMDGVFLSEQLGAEKPKKEFFDQVFAAIGPVEKGETMIVGDSLTSDIRGGDNAGIVTCWYNPEGIKAPEGYRIDHEIRDLHEVYGLLWQKKGRGHSEKNRNVLFFAFTACPLAAAGRCRAS